MSRRSLMISVLVGLSGCGALSAPEPAFRVKGPDYLGHSTSAQAYAAAKQQLSAGNEGLAIDLFRRAVRLDPTSVDALNGLAVAYDRVGRFDLSRRYYERALGFEPDSAMLLNNFGYSLVKQGEIDAGRSLLERAAASGDVQIANRSRTNLQLVSRITLSRLAGRAVDEQAESPRMWIERTADGVQTLVTKAARAITAIDPRIWSFHPAPSIGENMRTTSAPPIVKVSAREWSALINDGPTLTYPAADSELIAQSESPVRAVASVRFKPGAQMAPDEADTDGQRKGVI